MSRAALGVLLAIAGCHSPEPSATPDEIEARANEVRGRLLSKCQTGDQSACRRLDMPSSVTKSEIEEPRPGNESRQPKPVSATLEIDTWPAGATGLFLGTSPPEVAEDCANAGGQVLALQSDRTPVADLAQLDDGGTLICIERQKIDPLKRGSNLDRFLLLTSHMAMVRFCLLDSQLNSCSIQLSFDDHSPHFASELRRKLEESFGSMTPSKADFNCRLPSDRDVAVRGMWLWATTTLDDSEKPFPVGTLLLNYGCTPLVERPEPFFVLRDTIGMLREIGQLRGGQIVR